MSTRHTSASGHRARGEIDAVRGAKMRLVDDRLEYGRKDCTCQRGTVATQVACTTCSGTGNGPRGGRGGCRTCYGIGHAYDQVNRTTCGACGGRYVDARAENACDRVPDALVAALPVVVARSARPQTAHEALLGAGLYSLTDYGRWQHETDAAIIADVRRSTTHVQACKVAREDGTFADGLVVDCNRSGYTVRATYAGRTA